jgi:hypothetical protein
MRFRAEDRGSPGRWTLDMHGLTSTHVAVGDRRPPMHLSVGFGSHVTAPTFPAVTGYCNQWHCHCTFIAHPKLPSPWLEVFLWYSLFKVWFGNSQENTGRKDGVSGCVSGCVGGWSGWLLRSIRMYKGRGVSGWVDGWVGEFTRGLVNSRV